MLSAILRTMANMRRMRRRWIAVLVGGLSLMLASAPARAAQPGQRRPVVGTIVRIVNRLSGERSLGTGTLIAHQKEKQVGVVISCAHLFSDGVGDIALASPGEPPRRAVLVAKDEKNDLACLAVYRPAGEVVELAPARPSETEPLVSCGFGQDGRFLVNRGWHRGYVTLKGGAERGVLELSGAARHGDSGGPIFDAQGRLVGVIMGTDGRTVDGTHCEQVRRFLDENPLRTSHVEEVARLAQQPPEAGDSPWRMNDLIAQDEEQKPRPLTGVVRFAKQGVEGVKLRLTGPAARAASTDEAGRFAFEPLPWGQYWLEARWTREGTTIVAAQPVVIAGDAAELLIDLPRTQVTARPIR